MKRLSIIDLLRQKQGKRTAREFADELKVSPQFLGQIFRGERKLTPAMREALGLEKVELYVDHGQVQTFLDQVDVEVYVEASK